MIQPHKFGVNLSYFKRHQSHRTYHGHKKLINSLYCHNHTTTKVWSKSDQFQQGSYRNRKTVTHLILFIRSISFQLGIVNTFSLQHHCVCLISALRIVSSCYFRFCLSRYSLCKVSLPVAFDLFLITDFTILLIFVVHCIQKNCFYHFQGLFVIIKIFSKFQDNSRTNCTFLEFQEFSRTKSFSRTFQGLCKPCSRGIS